VELEGRAVAEAEGKECMNFEQLVATYRNMNYEVKIAVSMGSASSMFSQADWSR
jgi:hypothetical protein